MEDITIKPLPILEDIFSFSQEPTVNITFCDREISHRYMGVEIYDIEVKESPLWLKNRLRNCGCRSINNIVDITNYILLGLGQPLHAFDLDKIDGREIQIRFSKKGEKIYCLDGKEYFLDENIPIIADRSKPVALAGIIGGEGSSVSASTRNVFIECAHFVPSVIYSAMKKMNLLTEASLRFSRGVDIVKMEEALKYAVTLVLDIKGGKNVSKLIDVRNVPLKEKRIIVFPMKDVERYLGVKIEKEEVKSIFSRLSFAVDDQGETLQVGIPSYRSDVVYKVDLVEEVARLYGYNAIPIRPFNVSITGSYKNKFFDICVYIREILEGLGFHEIITYGFVSQKDIEVFNLQEAFMPIELINPISEEFSTLRPSLIPSMVKTIAYNNKFKQNNLMLYEMGHVFFKRNGEINEFSNLCIAISGRNINFASWLDKGFEFDYYALAGYVKVLFEKLNLRNYNISPKESNYFSEGESFAILLSGKEAGLCGLLDDRIAKHYEIDTKVYIAELAVDRILEKVNLMAKRFKEIDKYLPVRRDLSLIVPEKVKFSDIEEVIMQNIDASKIDVKLYVFDVYRADILPTGTYGLSVRLEFHFKSVPLQSSEVNDIVGKIVNVLGEKLSVKLREK
jgi:phenylalanyl-tRNA synthetase beta chain